LDIRFASGSRCEFRLHLDVPKARYRHAQGAGAMSKMCDFAAGAIQTDGLRVLVIELKKGAADPDAVDQLQEGLKLIKETLGGSPAGIRVEAYLAAGKQTAQLKNLRRGRKAFLWFDQSRVELKVRDCGEVVNL